MYSEFLRLLFLQAHRETEAHFTAAGMCVRHKLLLSYFCSTYYKARGIVKDMCYESRRAEACVD
jgi:hypothetical protein